MHKGSVDFFSMLLFCACVGLAPISLAKASELTPSKTFQTRTCSAWDRQLHGLLDWSERLNLHTPEFRGVIRAEALKLQVRCLRDLSMASLNRYVLLMKVIYDDEADEVESYD